MNNLYLIKSGDNGFVEETSAVISAEGGDISINSSLHVDSAGNIGIGSSNPTNKLDVVGSASISNDLTVDNIILSSVGGQLPANANDIIVYNGTNWVVGAASQLPGGGGGAGNSDVPAGLINPLTKGESIHEVNFGFDSNDDRIVYDNVPKIAASLEIDGPGEIIPHTVSGVSESGYFVVFSEELPTANYRMHTVFGGTDAFWETGVSNLEYSERNVEIDRSLYVGQKVGIGTTSPSSKLHITAAHSDTNSIDNLLTLEAVEKSGQDLQPGDGLGILFKVPVGNNETSAIGARIAAVREGGTESATSTELVFEVSQQDETLDEAMRIDRDGNVGIGTTNPADELHINSAGSNVNLRLTRDTDTGGRISCSDGADTPAIIFETIDSGSLSEKMRIDSDGNVGIGTTNPHFNLSVVSDTNPANIGIHGYGSFSDGSVAARLVFLGKDSNGNNRNLAHIQVKEHSHTSGTGSMEFFTRIGGNEAARMTIDEVGNVGIGTTNPNLTGLQLGTALVVSSATGGDIVAHKSGSSVNIGDICGSLLIANSDTDGAEDHFVGMWGKASSTNGSQNLHLAAGRSGYEGDAPHMTILSDGNVGIGTTSPSSLLHLQKSVAAGDAEVLMLRNPLANAVGESVSIAFQGATQIDMAKIEARTQGSNALGAPCDLVFQTASSGSAASDRMIIDSNGNVGIGTTSPAEKLQLNSEDLGEDLRIRLLAENEGGVMKDGYIVFDPDADFMALSSTQAINGIGVDNNGNVGIGTTNPDYLLHVSKNSSSAVISARSQGMGNTSGWGGYIFANAHDGTSGWSTIIGTYRPSTNVGFASTIRLAPRTGSNRYLYLDPSGDFRISATLSNVGADAGDYVSGQTSDERLKDIEDNFEYGLNKVMQLKPIAYKLKSDENQVRKLGFGAQTTQDIVPEAVFDTSQCIDGYDQDPEDEHGQIPRSEDTTLGMQYVQLIPVLTKAIQEQQTIIEDLKSRIETLEQ